MGLSSTKDQSIFCLRKTFPAFWTGFFTFFSLLSPFSSQAYDALEVRIYNQTGTDDAGVSLLGIGTGTSDTTGGQFSMYYYPTNGGLVQITNRAKVGLAPNSPLSVILTNLPQGSDSVGTYRSMFVDYVQSGLLVFGLTTNTYSNTTNNPNSTQAGDGPGDWGGVIWNQAELSYTGGTGPGDNGASYDTIDVTAINQVGIPMLLQMMTNTNAPAPVVNGTKGYTNTNNIQTMLRLLNSIPGAPWFFAAPQTNTANWLGPSTAAKPSLIMPICQNTNLTNTLIWQAGWPGAVTPTFAPYVKSVFTNVPALGTNTNGTKIFARISNSIGLANVNRTNHTNAGSTTYHYAFDFTLLPNPRATNLYSTPIPVLTNGVLTVVDSYGGGPGVPITNTFSNLWIRYTPDGGSPTNSWFSSYIYQAPSSYLNGASTNLPNPPSGFVTWATGWTNLATNYSFNWYYFVANAFDAMANDIAFGFAGGFVNSPVTGSYQVVTGTGTNAVTNTVTTNVRAMPSYGWWQQTMLYSDLQTNSPPGYSNSYYSAYGDAVYRASRLVYSHPISDRMTNAGLAPGLSLVPANNNPDSFLAITLLPVTVSGGPGVPGFSNNANFLALTNTNLPWTNSLVFQYTNTNTAGLMIPLISGIGASNALWVAADGLPPGLRFNPTNGTVSGTIPFGVSGKYLVRFQAANSNGTVLAAIGMNIIGPPKNSGKGLVYGPTLLSNQIGTSRPSVWLQYNTTYTNSMLTFVASNCVGATYNWGSNAPPGVSLSNFINAAGLSSPQIIGTITNTNWPTNIPVGQWGPLPGGLTSSIVISNNYGVSTSVVVLGITNSGAVPTNNFAAPSWTSPTNSSGAVYLRLIQNQANVPGSGAQLLTGTNMANATLVSVSSNLPAGLGILVSNSPGTPSYLQAWVTGTPTQTTWSFTNTNVNPVNVTFVLSNNIGTNGQVVPFEVVPSPQPTPNTNLPSIQYAGGLAANPAGTVAQLFWVNQPIPISMGVGSANFNGGTNVASLWQAQWATPTNLPPGLYFTPLPQTNSGFVNAAIYGIPITTNLGSNNMVVFTVTNRYGVLTTNYMVGTMPTNTTPAPLIAPYNPGPLANVTSPPVFFGSNTATAGTNESVDWPVNVSNYPSVFNVTNLPPGLNLVMEWDDTNTLFNLSVTGRPTTPNVYTSTVIASNYWGSATQAYVLTITGPVSQPPQFTWRTNVLVGTQSSPVLFPVNLQGERPITLTNSPALPLNLTLAQDQYSNWLVSGIPQSGGTNTVTLTASNAAGSASTNLILRIAWLTPPAPVINPPFQTKGTSGVAFNFQVQATNTTNFSSPNLPAGLSINATSGLITGTNSGPSAVYSSTITAVGDGGQTNRVFMITITNTNVAPVFTSSSNATGQVGTNFLFTNTVSNSATPPVTFGAASLPAGLSLNATSGVISGTPTSAGTNTWIITASNAGGVTNRDLTLEIAPVAGPVPSSFSPTSAIATQGVAFSLQMTASNSPTNWSATGLPTNLAINSNGLITGMPQTNGTNFVTLTAVNSNGSGEGYGTLVVRPTVPVFTNTNQVSGKQGQALSFTVAATSSATVTYSATGLPGNLQIHPSSGLISSPNVNTNGTFTSTITASNWGTAGTQSLVFTIGTALPVFTSTNEVTGTQGVALTPFQATVSNGPATFTQQGLTTNYSFSSFGLLTGIPQLAGTSTVTLIASNSFGATSQSLQLRIAAAPPTPAPVITSTNAVTGTSGVDFSFAVLASNATNYFAAPLPPGLSINLTSGVIAGTNSGPTAVTTSTVTVRGAGGVTNQQLRITITNTNVAPTFTSATFATGRVGVAFLFTNTAAGSAPISFANPGGLPSGLARSNTTGVITGTPTAAGTNTWTITASNAGGVTNQLLQLRIASAVPGPVPSSFAPTSAIATQGVAFSLPMTASNSPTNWSAANLPSGLSINATSGVIFGTNTSNGTNTVKLTAVNSNGAGEGNLTLVVRPTAPVFTNTNLVRGTQGQQVNFMVVATSSASVTYTATGLPANLTINSDGQISGIPATNGTFSASVVAATWGNSTTQALRFLISPASTGPVITSATNASGIQGQRFTYRTTATGAPTITYGAAPLPAGLSVNSGSGLISGTPTTNGTFNVQMTAANGSGTNVQTLNLTISSDSINAPVITSPTLVFGRQGTPFTGYTITASNRPTSFGASGLPPGLRVVPATGVVTGTPSINGTYTSTVTASNAAGLGSRAVRFIISIPR